MCAELTFANELVKTATINVNSLSKAALFTTPTDYDFSSDNWAEMRSEGGWESTEPVECESCGAVYVVYGFSCECENEDCERSGETIAEDLGPMMNYYYELPDRPDDDGIRQLADLPLCVVTIDGDRYALALTGGGMDLSWEICEAFMRLGYLPPLHFANLPAMAGRGHSDRDRQIAAACIASAKAAAEITDNRAAYTIEGIKHALDFGQQHERERRQR